MQRLFFELPVIKNPKAKKLATLVLMNEFDYIVREAGDFFYFYGMSREKPVIDEILYNSDYILRHLFGNNNFFDENLFEGRAYQVEEIEKKKYIARHNDVEKCEKWSVIDYEVTMSDDGEWFECECGQFTLMGMLCYHAWEVLFISILRIPLLSAKNHILISNVSGDGLC